MGCLLPRHSGRIHTRDTIRHRCPFVAVYQGSIDCFIVSLVISTFIKDCSRTEKQKTGKHKSIVTLPMPLFGYHITDDYLWIAKALFFPAALKSFLRGRTRHANQLNQGESMIRVSKSPFLSVSAKCL